MLQHGKTAVPPKQGRCFYRQSLRLLFQQLSRQFLGLISGHPQAGIKSPIFLEIIVGVRDNSLGGACTYDELAVFQLNVRNSAFSSAGSAAKPHSRLAASRPQITLDTHFFFINMILPF